MTIYTEFRKTFTDIKKLIPLKNIIHDIQYGKYQEQIKTIQNETDEKKQKRLKKKLPSFKPTLNDGIANGIIQLEIDPKDNPDLDIDKTKQILSNLPEIVYCFLSPRKGLKFAILSDFEQYPDDVTRITISRFKDAYYLCKDYIVSHIGAELDDSLSSITQDCFVSFDKDAYFNGNCKKLIINDQCHYVPPITEQSLSFINSDEFLLDEVIHLLSFISNNLKYDKRLPINWSVLNLLGEQGKQVLLNHWIKKDREKLKKQINEQALYECDNNLRTLKGIAKKTGYNSKKPFPALTHKFPPLLSVEKGKKALEDAVKMFFDELKSILLNSSTGLGKTTIMIEFVKQLPKDNNVLIVVKTHKLMVQMKNDFYKIKSENNVFKMDLSKKVNMIKGRDKCCEDCPKYLKYRGVTIPKPRCDAKHKHNPCQYIKQFESDSNVNIMTHDELFNRQGQYHLEHKPDYIVVDENIITSDKNTADTDSHYQSIVNIIKGYNDGIDMDDDPDIKQQLIDDMALMKSKKFPSFDHPNYIEEFKDVADYHRDKKILEIFYDCFVNDNEDALNQVRIDENTVRHHYIKEIQDRYKNIPIMFLDATANKTIAHQVLGQDFEFIDIKAEQSPDVKVHQLIDLNITKTWLLKEVNRQRLKEYLIKLTGEYETVGLVTYKNVRDHEDDKNDIEDFDLQLQEETQISIIDHFGNIRGLNKFEDCDCYVVIGRECINPYDLVNHYASIFDVPIDYELIGDMNNVAPTPIRMSDGKTYLKYNHFYQNEQLEKTNKFYNLSETIQTIGRGRLIYGKPKTIIYLSSESLGEDVAISKFIYEKDIFLNHKYDDHIVKIHDKGYCRNRHDDFLNLGISKYYSQKIRHQDQDELLANDLKLESVWIGGNKIEFYVSDQQKFDEYVSIAKAEVKNKKLDKELESSLKMVA